MSVPQKQRHEIELPYDQGYAHCSYKLHRGTLVRIFSKHQRGVVDCAVSRSDRNRDLAYLTPLPSVIAAYPMEEEAQVIEVFEGDELVLQGQVYVINDNKPFNDPQLTEVTK